MLVDRASGTCIVTTAWADETRGDFGSTDTRYSGSEVVVRKLTEMGAEYVGSSPQALNAYARTQG